MSARLELPAVGTDHAYWLGWLAATIQNTLVDLELVHDPDGENARPLMSRDDVTASLRDKWDIFLQSEVGQRIAVHMDERTLAGFVVEAADGEPQALRRTLTEAEQALADVDGYWSEAERCGHPSAPGYVAALRPFRIRQITKAEREQILEDGVPTIDREP